MPAVSTVGGDEVEASEANAGNSEAMVVEEEEEKTAEDAMPGGKKIIKFARFTQLFLTPLPYELSLLTEMEKPKYTCEICGKAYIRSWSFYGHMREHASGDKQHKCTVCEKVFNYASNLRQHMLIHTGRGTGHYH